LDGGVPLVFLGYSMGGLYAYECARVLEHHWGVTAAAVVTLAGFSRENFAKFVWLDYEDRRNPDLYYRTDETNLGRAAPQVPQLLKTLSTEQLNKIFDMCYVGESLRG
jgi:thioesterase domain-containing protein